MTSNKKLLAHYVALLGMRETPGPTSTGRILAMIRRWVPWATDDSTTAWCGVLRADAAQATGTESPAHPERARSWLAVGVSVPLAEARPGDTVVLRRGAGLGHVGLVADEWDGGDSLEVIGGNQRNRVCILALRISDIIDIRRVA